MKRKQSYEAEFQHLIQSFQEVNQAIVESAIAGQERNLQLAQRLYADWFAALQDHTQNQQTLMQEMEHQIQQQQHVYQKLVQESVASYFDSLLTGLTFFEPMLRLTEKLQICLLALASRYPHHRVTINEEILGPQAVRVEGWKAAELIELLEHTSPQLLQENARLEVNAQRKGIYLLEHSEEVPAFWVYCGVMGEKPPSYRDDMAARQGEQAHSRDKVQGGHVPVDTLQEAVR
jgi:hypothetical protein